MVVGAKQGKTPEAFLQKKGPMNQVGGKAILSDFLLNDL